MKTRVAVLVIAIVCLAAFQGDAQPLAEGGTPHFIGVFPLRASLIIVLTYKSQTPPSMPTGQAQQRETTLAST